MNDLYEDIREAFVLLEIRVSRALDRCGLRIDLFNALRVLDEGGPLRMGELARRLLLDDSRTTRTVDSLVQAGFAGRAADPEDRRALNVTITAQGRHALAGAGEAVGEAVAHAVAPMSQRDRERTASALGRLRRVLRDYSEESTGE